MYCCDVCHHNVATNDVLFTTKRDLVCARCHVEIELVEADELGARNIVRAANVALATSVLAFARSTTKPGSISDAIVALAIIAAVYALARLDARNRATSHLTEAQARHAQISSIVGIAIAAMTLDVAPWIAWVHALADPR